MTFKISVQFYGQKFTVVLSLVNISDNVFDMQNYQIFQLWEFSIVDKSEVE